MTNLELVFDQVKREDFCPLPFFDEAKKDTRVPIGFGQNSTKPSVVKYMVTKLIEELDKLDSVLEIGTGCGYQTAILSKLFKKVYTIEYIPEMSKRAQKLLSDYKNIEYIIGDGGEGLPFKVDGIIAGTAFETIPPNWNATVIVCPVGNAEQQNIIRTTKDKSEALSSCGFVLRK